MELFKRFLGFILLIVSCVVGFYYVSIMTPFDFMTNYIGSKWFVNLGEFVHEWGVTLLVVLGMSKMIAINNKVAICITTILYILLSVLIIMSIHYPLDLAKLLGK